MKHFTSTSIGDFYNCKKKINIAIKIYYYIKKLEVKVNLVQYIQLHME